MASVTKRRWRKPDGSFGEGWQVRYIDPATGKRPGKMFELKKDAEAFRRKVQREIEDGLHVAGAKVASVADVLDAYFDSRQAKVKDGRLGLERATNVEGQMRKHVYPAIGKIAWRDLKSGQIEELYRGMVDRRGLSPVYAKGIISDLRLAERYAVRHGHTKAKPVDDAMSELRGIPKPRISVLSLTDAATILREALRHQHKAERRTEERTACFVHLAACCGLRVGEIIALNRADVDLERGVIHVRRNMTTLGRMKGTKTRSGERDVPLPEHLVGMIANWITTRFVCNDAGLLFTNDDGSSCHHSAINKSWRKLLLSAGLFDAADVYHFHALRHFAGSWWLQNGMTVPDVSKLLGHANPAITMQIYIHSLSQPEHRAVALKANATRLLSIGTAANDAVSDAQVTHRMKIA